MDKFKKQLKIYWDISWLRRSTLAAIIVSTILLAIPIIIQYSITHLLVKQGATTAEIDDINLNLFSGTFELKKLIISSADNKPSGLQHAYINLNMLDLLSSRVVLHEVLIDGLDTIIQRTSDGTISVAGLAIPVNPSTSDNTTESTADDTSSKPIAFGLNKLSLTNSNINYQEPKFSHNNQINSINLSNLKSWDKTAAAKLVIDAILNDATFALTTDLYLFDETLRFKGKTSLGSLAFAPYEKFYSQLLDSLQGSISFDSEFDISLSDTITAKLTNNIQVVDLDINYQGIRPTLQNFELQGTTQASHIDIASFLKGNDSSNQNKLLNLFSGSITLDQLSISSAKNKASQVKHVSINIDKLDALSNRFTINELLIEGIDTHIKRDDNGQISIKGLVIPVNKTASKDATPTDDKQPKPVTFAVGKLSITDSDINYQETDFDQINHISSIIISNIKSWDKASTSNLDLDLMLNKAPFQLKADLNLFSDVKKIKGSASLGALSFSHYEKFYRNHIDSLQGSIKLDSTFDISLGNSIAAKLSNNIQLADLNLGYQELSQSVKSIHWKGNTLFSEESELTTKGNLQIKNSTTTDLKQKYVISSFDSLTIKDLKKELENISFKQLGFTNLQLVNLQKDNRLLALKGINIQDARFNTKKEQLTIKQVGLDQPDINIELTKLKQVSQLAPLLKTIDRLKPPSTESTKKQKKQKSAKPVTVQIGSLKLLNPGTVDFSDLSVSPIYKTQIKLNQLDIDNISSLNKAQFDIALKQSDYTTFNIKGDGLLFDPTKFIQFTANIEQFDLPPVTPYTSQAMGYGMKSGVIDSNIQMTLKDREIESEVELIIDSIEVIETDKGTAEQVSSASGMSIDLAISSLKDDKNMINLKLPVKGNIDKPDFKLTKVLNLAMGKAMKSATMSYLKHSLQPFGSLISLYSLAKKAANHIALPPLLFKPNSLVFKDKQQALLDKVIKVLNERPGLKIKACGISALEDQQAIKAIFLDAEIARLAKTKKVVDQKTVKSATSEIDIDPALIQQKMKELADSRSAKVKAFFLEQGDLNSNRILNCLSTTSTEEKSVPSVELLI